MPIERRPPVTTIALAVSLAVLLFVSACRTEPPRRGVAGAPTATPPGAGRPTDTATRARATAVGPALATTPSTPLSTTVTTSTAIPPRLAPQFAADAAALDSGACTVLRWRLPVSRDVDLDGVPVPSAGERQVCPETTRAYRLTWRGPTGEAASLAVTVTVRAPALNIAPPTFKAKEKGSGRATPGGAGAATATGCTPCAGSTRRPTQTPLPPETLVPPATSTRAPATPVLPTPAASAAPPPTAAPTAPGTP